MKIAKVRAHSCFFILLACLALSALLCAPKPVIKPVVVVATPPEPETLENPEGMATEKIKQKILQYETMLQSNDTMVFSKDELLAGLFDLYIHESNLEPSFRKANILADSLVRTGFIPGRRQYFLNWKKMLEIYLETCSSKDSLERMLGQLNEETKTIRVSARKQTKLIDSLSAVVDSQKVIIGKLQDLDLRMEKQRSKIP
jgi:hypothetical protein